MPIMLQIFDSDWIENNCTVNCQSHVRKLQIFHLYDTNMTKKNYLIKIKTKIKKNIHKGLSFVRKRTYKLHYLVFYKEK